MKIDRELLVSHAKNVLMSGLKGIELAQVMKMNVNQFYDYRNGVRDIKSARLETLLKFEQAYIYIEHKQKN